VEYIAVRLLEDKYIRIKYIIILYIHFLQFYCGEGNEGRGDVVWQAYQRLPLAQPLVLGFACWRNIQVLKTERFTKPKLFPQVVTPAITAGI
jgi:hypothetical protein